MGQTQLVQKRAQTWIGVQRAQQWVDLGPEDAGVPLNGRPLKPLEGKFGLASHPVRLGNLIGGLAPYLSASSRSAASDSARRPAA